MGRLRLAVIVLLLAVLAPGAAAAYPWPVKPFDRQHPIRAFFGDPRTVYYNGILTDPFGGTGVFAFHQGVDVAAPNGTPVYPVADGRVDYLGSATLNVNTKVGLTFQYFHLVPVVGQRQLVRARRTVLGYVQAPFAHVHITEINGGSATNPLQRGHLTPFRDGTKPRIRSIDVADRTGVLPTPGALCGRVQLSADAFDVQPIPVPGAFGGFPVAPALVRWTLTRLDGSAVVPWSTTADFRTRLPPNGRFWSTYAHGTYENAPRFGREQYGSTPGRFLFLLAPGYDTTRIPNGAYTITVEAADERGNTGVASRQISVLNAPGAHCSGSLLPPGALPPAPPPPPEPHGR
jgi:hypothetical protein